MLIERSSDHHASTTSRLALKGAVPMTVACSHVKVWCGVPLCVAMAEDVSDLASMRWCSVSLVDNLFRLNHVVGGAVTTGDVVNSLTSVKSVYFIFQFWWQCPKSEVGFMGNTDTMGAGAGDWQVQKLFLCKVL